MGEIVNAEEGNRFSFKGWNIKEFLKGRKKLLVTAIGAIVGWVTTQNPAWAAIAAAGAELIYALFDYWVQK